MQGPTHHVSPIKNWQQLVVVVALAFLVPIAVIILLSQYVTDVSIAPDVDVLPRIRPVGEVLVEPASGAKSADAPAASATAAKSAAPVPAPSTAAAPKTAAAPATSAAAVATAPAAPAAAAKPDGKKIYDTTCVACHGPGVAGAPKLGDKAAWAPRLKLGLDAIHASALKGKGAMPAKGGNASLSDADVKSAVDYMLATAK